MNDSGIKLGHICAQNGIRLEDAARERLEEYVRLLLEWNAKVNLISRKDQENVWENHILHALSILFVLSIEQGAEVLDLGTGGGLPGIPLSIVRPDLSVVCLDSILKKTVAVTDMVERLGLGNVAVWTGRAEEIVKKENRKFDIVVARAVAPLKDLVRWSRPFLKRGVGEKSGRLIAMKGGDLDGEIREIGTQGRIRGVELLPLVYRGSELVGLEDKKIVVIHFS